MFVPKKRIIDANKRITALVNEAQRKTQQIRNLEHIIANKDRNIQDLLTIVKLLREELNGVQISRTQHHPDQESS